jgi:PAS domain S-box-containing protein
VAHDVTERRRTDQALREQAELLRESQRVASVGHYSLDIVAEVLTTSEGFDDVFGMGTGYPRTFAGWLDLVHPDDRDRLGVHYQEHVLRDKLPFELEYRILRPRDDVERWVRGLGKLELDADGLPARMFGIVQDVTERRRAEDALRRSGQRFQAMIEQGADGVSILAQDGTILYDGPTTERLTGYRPEDRVGQNGLSAAFAEDLPVLRAALARLIAEPGRVERLEFRAVRKDGTVWSAEAAAVNLLAEPSVAGIVVNYRDVSERKRGEAERLELERRLLRAQKLDSLGILAGGVAHDFNNLLTGIIGSLELATLGLPADSPAREDIENARRASRRAAELSRKMLSYSGKGRFVIQRLELCEVVRGNERLMLAALAPGTRLDLRLCSEPCSVEADKDQVEQALLALVSNAAEAIGERQGVIRLSTGVVDCDQRYLGASRIDPKPAPGRFAYIEIADTGCGMDEATLDKVFDPFFSTKFAGRGLGLPVVLGIARGHKGAILVDSTPGNGTRVRVLWPSIAAGTSNAQPAVQPAPQLVAARATVLVVDDEDAVREPCLQLVRRLGFDTLAASDGLQGLALVRKHGDEIACVLLDLTMPGMDGVATLLMMRRLRPGLRVILSSGYGEQDVMERFGVERPDAFLQKPYAGEDLRKALASVLARTS